MTSSGAGEPRTSNEPALARRDRILLPALGLLTICLLGGSLELMGTWMFPWAGRSLTKCMVLNDPSTGLRGIPNTVCWGRIEEGQPVEYRFNSHGHRAGMEWGPKPQGTYRIVMPGSSVVFGDGVASEQTFAALLPAKLSRQTGRKVEVYNEGMGFGFPRSVALRFDNEVLAAEPDMILWALTPTDIENVSELGLNPALEKNGASGKSASFLAIALDKVKQAFSTKSIPETLTYILNQTRTAFLLQHFLDESQSQYLKNVLMRGGPPYLRTEPDAKWQSKLQQFDSYAAEVEQKARRAGVPLVAVLLPVRAQAALISLGEWPEGIDPYKADRDVRSIITSHGGTFIDIFPAFRNIPNPEQYYFPLDGHLDASGNAMISDLLAGELTRGAVPALRGAAPAQSSPERGR
jgi:hypothetical protein